jgi:hypothetical protein
LDLPPGTFRLLPVEEPGDLELPPFEPADPTFRNAEVTALRKACADHELYEMIDACEKADHDLASLLEDARLDGLEQGRKKLRATARGMRREGLSPEAVARLTGLSPEELGE